MFLGNIGGCIGEVSACGAPHRRHIPHSVPGVISATYTSVSFLAHCRSCAVFLWGGLDRADLPSCCAGGAMLGAFFCATDYVTSPMLPIGQGHLRHRLRSLHHAHKAVRHRTLKGCPSRYSLMNVLTPYIDRVTEKLMYTGCLRRL